MPVMEGMELLAELRKRNPEIPVVILSGCGRREDVIEALRLGASNFLLKPQEVEMIRSIAEKILRVRTRERLEQEIFNFFVEERQFYEIQNDLRYTIPLIDLLTEKVVKIGICNDFNLMNIRLALDEALVNAVVHGNLGLPSREKGATLEELMKFNQLVKDRSRQEPFCNRKIRVSYHLTQDFVRYEIQDDGEGFNWRAIPENLDEVEITASHGRGLFLIRAFMSDVKFNDKGNCIILTKFRQAPLNSTHPPLELE